MGKSINSVVLDQSLAYIRANTTRMTICSAEPTTYAQANSTFALGSVAMAPGDFTLANGDVSGRKITVAAKNGNSVAVAGTATHVALLDVANLTLLLVTTCASQAVANGGTFDVASFKDEIQAPT
ncbi:hypothetical protein [Novosphingobium huizhouense]|uniref:hypothetical protein n=1 Tax=Novosphingobium huizhouense TaxID=2866625 RepID=UPI001CD85FD6|nr:hypothetical protein [Novosphingobium huizhouense]